jgi:hypothetical protein
MVDGRSERSSLTSSLLHFERKAGWGYEIRRFFFTATLVQIIQRLSLAIYETGS